MNAAERDKLLAERQTGVGGSDVHHLFDLEPYGCRRRLGYEKLGFPPDFPLDPSKGPLLRGLMMEEVTARLFAMRTGRRIQRIGMRRHKGDPWLIVHMDRRQGRMEGRAKTGVCEIKAPGYWSLKKHREEGLIDAYQLQVDHAFLVTGRRWGSFVLLDYDSFDVEFWDVERDEHRCGLIRTSAAAFWRDVEAERLAPRLEPDSPQCQGCPFRYSCQGRHIMDSVQKPREERFFTDESPEVLNAAIAYNHSKKIADEASEVLEGDRKRLLAKLGGKTPVLVPKAEPYNYFVTATFERKSKNGGVPEVTRQLRPYVKE